VHRVVNVATDPALGEAALQGTLHRLDSGETLAVAFVYHDPAARKMALVLPLALRHRELTERARLLSELATDVAHPIPDYVRRFETVVGPEGLARFASESGKIDDGALAAWQDDVAERERSLAERELSLAEREQGFEQSETEHRERGDALTERERELKLYFERLEAHERELALREQELEGRFEALREREAALATDAGPAETEVDEGDIEEIDDADEASAVAGAEEAAETVGIEAFSDADPLDADPFEANPLEVQPLDGDSAQTLAGDVRALDSADGDRVSSELIDEADVEEVDDDDLEAIEATNVAARPSTEAGAARAEPARPESARADSAGAESGPSEPAAGEAPPRSPQAHSPAEARGPVPSELTQEIDLADGESLTGVRDMRPAAPAKPASKPPKEPPAAFYDDPHQPLAASLEDGRVWLFARLEEGYEDRFAAAKDGVDLRVQLARVDDYPVVVLALVDAVAARPYVRRIVLDPQAPEHRELLDALAEDFSARVAVFTLGDRFERTLDLSAPRAGNVALALEEADAADARPADSATALERAFAVPPPVRDEPHPFFDEADEPTTVSEALSIVSALEPWCKEERLDYALLVLSVPSVAVERTFDRAVTAALRFGAALPGPLAERALRRPDIADAAELVGRLARAFRETLAEGSHGLDEERQAANWERLLHMAQEAEVSLDEESYDLALAQLRRVRGDAAAPKQPRLDSAKLADMGAPELVLALDHPKARLQAALELCRRGDPELLGPLFQAVRKMPRDEVAAVLPAILSFGEAAGDVLIDGLGAKKTFVRQAAAVALGELELRRSVGPLVTLLKTEPSDVWKEVARVLGELQTAALRPIVRALKEPEGLEERYAYVLAHLVHNGCGDQVRELREEDDATVVAIAAKALTLRNVVKEHTSAVRETGTERPADPVLAFSRRLYEAMEGGAPSDG
jgi:hypothetical protein